MNQDTLRIIYSIEEDGSVKFEDGDQDIWDMIHEGGLDIAKVLKDAEYIKGIGGKL